MITNTLILLKSRDVWNCVRLMISLDKMILIVSLYLLMKWLVQILEIVIKTIVILLLV